MIPDPNDEILANKRRLAAKFDNDLHRIAEDVRRRQAEGDREILTLPPRRYEPRVTPNKSLEPTEAAILTSRDIQSLPAAPAVEL